MATIGYLAGGISRAGDEAVNASGEAATGLARSWVEFEGARKTK